FALSGDANPRAGEFAHQFHQLAGRQGDGAFLVDRGGHRGADGDVEIGSRESQPVLGRLEQDVAEPRQRGLAGPGAVDRLDASGRWWPTPGTVSLLAPRR